jgi:hypothetical protein
MRRCLVWLSILSSAFFANSVAAVDYYVSCVGDDAQDGTVPDRAWRTVARAQRQALRPGDRLLFRGGDTFDGNIVVKITGAPSARAPITIRSYGQGKATLRAGKGTGIAVENCGGVVIRDLIVDGQDRRSNKGSGVSILNTLPAARCLEHVRIENVEARRFGKYGIAVGGWPDDKSQSGFRDVRISRCRASDNVYVGIHVYGIHDFYAKTYAHHDVAVIDCVAHDNPGDPDYLDNHSGSGILLHDVDGGRIDGCAAFGNGSLCRAQGGGPVGIWAWASRKLVIQNCVSVRNRTGGPYDGGGFDFDGGVSESILQYNYSAENDGAGYLVFDFGAAPFPLANNVVRFNVSENDGRKNAYAGITVNSFGGPITGLHLLHNLVYVGPSEAKESGAALFIGKSKNCRVHNNLFIAAGRALAHIGSDASGLCIQGNHYWASGSPFLVRHSGKEYRSLATWRQHAEVERLDGKEVGSTGDPLLMGLLPGVPPTEASKRTALERFQLRAGSPLRGAGVDVKKLFGIDIGDRDFWGNPLPRNHPAAVGVQGSVDGRLGRNVHGPSQKR